MNVKKARKNDFLKFIENHYETYNYNYSKETIKSYNAHISVLRQFSPRIKFADITPSFVGQYFNFVVSVRHLSENSAYKKLSVLRTFVNIAIKQKKIKNNPFEFSKIREFEGSRDFLTIAEMQRIEKYYQKTNDKFARWFLFSCYTGLRYYDLFELRKIDIKNRVIQIRQHKTADIVRIPLCKQAIELIDDEDSKTPKVFNLYCNQYVNRHLKAIAVICKIEKHLTFHISRHTFATTSLKIGNNIEVVSKLLGHKSIKTTMIYAHITDDLKIQAMQKFNNLSAS